MTCICVCVCVCVGVGVCVCVCVWEKHLEMRQINMKCEIVGYIKQDLYTWELNTWWKYCLNKICKHNIIKAFLLHIFF